MRVSGTNRETESSGGGEGGGGRRGRAAANAAAVGFFRFRAYDAVGLFVVALSEEARAERPAAVDGARASVLPEGHWLSALRCAARGRGRGGGGPDPSLALARAPAVSLRGRGTTLSHLHDVVLRCSRKACVSVQVCVSGVVPRGERVCEEEVGRRRAASLRPPPLAKTAAPRPPPPRTRTRPQSIGPSAIVTRRDSTYSHRCSPRP
jgi:hypothetical protein